MATIVTDILCDLTQPVKVQYLHGNLFSQDNAANTINVHVHSAGVPESLGGTISANVIRSDGGTVAVAGSVSGDTATVVLPQACYAVPGVIHIIIKSTVSSVVTTIAAVVANVYTSSTDTVVDPGTIITDVAALIDAIEDAVDSIPVDYSGLLATIAADYSSSKTYPVVGTYAWQGGVLKRNIVPITTAESYTAAHWTNAVLGDDVSDLKSAFNSVTNDENLFDTSTAIDGKRINGSGGLQDDTGVSFTSALIPVKPGMYYAKNSPTLDIRHRIAVYDSTGTFISGQLFELNLIKIPANGAYIRFCGLLTEKSTAELKMMSANDYIFRDNISETVSLSNILTGTTWENGWVSQTTGSVTENDSYTTTDYIAVTGGKYIVSCLNNARCEMFTIGVYDSEKTVIAGNGATGNGTQGLSGYFKLPASAAYVKITYRTSVYSSSIVVYQYDYNIGYNSSDFYNIKEKALMPVYAEINNIKSEIQNKWHGKTMLSIGDSQTAQNKWQPFVASFFGMDSLVQGFSGETVAVSNPNNVGNCISSNYTIGLIDTYLADKDFDVLLFMGGTNDWRYDGVKHEGYSNILIGENTDMVNTTFKGALKKIVAHFQAEYPTKTIVLMSNIGGRAIDAAGETPRTGMTEPLVNNNGYTQATFAQATKEMAEYLGVPYIDVYSCGINIYNTASYLQDGLHINSTTGAKKVADCVISGLLGIQPYCD